MEKRCYKDKKWCSNEKCKKYKYCKDSFWTACGEQAKIGKVLRIEFCDLSEVCVKGNNYIN